MSFEEDEYYYHDPSIHTRRQFIKKNAPDGKHMPNKSEGNLLRKLMSKYKMSESEVRSHKVYRQQLAEARKLPELTSEFKNKEKKIKIQKLNESKSVSIIKAT